MWQWIILGCGLGLAADGAPEASRGASAAAFANEVSGRARGTPPDYLLVAPGGAFGALWSGPDGLDVRVFDAQGRLVARHGASRGDALRLEAGRTPVLRAGQHGDEIVLPLVGGGRRTLVLATGALGPLENRSVAEWTERAREASRCGELAVASESYRRAVDADPTDAEAWRGLTRALEREGDKARARETLALAVETLQGGRTQPVSMDWSVCDPRARLSVALVELRAREGDGEGAAETLDALAKLYPCMEEPTLLRARLALATAGTPEEGRAAADRILYDTIERLDEPRARAAAHLAAAAFQESNGALERALAHFGHASRLGEDREVVARSIARIEVARGNHGAALEQLRTLLQRWREAHATFDDARRLEHSKERIDRLAAEIAELERRASALD